MNTYVYDGSFEGLLTAIFYSYKEKNDLDIVTKNKFVKNFINQEIIIERDDEIFKRVYESIKYKLSQNTLKNVYYLYLSEVQGSEKIIYDYLKLCYKYGDRINLAKNNDIICYVDKLYRRVSLEAHRFEGFVRFKEIGQRIFYSEIEPDYNILPLIMDQFAERFSDQHFIIHDTKREMAIIYDTNEVYMKEMSINYRDRIREGAKKDEFESLFKVFYNSINIEERYNPRQRNSYMPKRYWKNLIEVEEN